jgi:hypothetical protein
MLRRFCITGLLLTALCKLGGEPVHMAPSEFDALVRQELASNPVIVPAAGLKAN